MGDLMKAEDLLPGDVFFDHRWAGHGLRRAVGVRTITISSGSFAVVDYVNIKSGLDGQVSCIHGAEVIKVQPHGAEQLADAIAALAEFEPLTMFRVGDEVWA